MSRCFVGMRCERIDSVHHAVSNMLVISIALSITSEFFPRTSQKDSSACHKQLRIEQPVENERRLIKKIAKKGVMISLRLDLRTFCVLDTEEDVR